MEVKGALTLAKLGGSESAVDSFSNFLERRGQGGEAPRLILEANVANPARFLNAMLSFFVEKMT